MWIRMLGPLQLRTGGGWTGIRAAQPRLLLAVLLVEAGQTVTTDRLVDEIWGDRPPRTATGTVQVYVMRLRRMLEGRPVALVTHGHGYQLVAEDGAVDTSRFQRCAEAGRRSLAAGETRKGVDELTEALRLWRGRPFADVPPSHTVTAASQRWEQMRLAVAEDRFGGALDLHCHAEVIDELAELVQAHPFRERLHGLLMTALYRDGRRAEAVAAYDRVRRSLAAELGLEPSPALRQLHQAILTDSSELTAPGTAGPVAPHAPARPAGGSAAPGGSSPPDGSATTGWRSQVAGAAFPEDVTGFTGRQIQLALLDAAVDRGETLIAIDGMAGVGKTALAVHWAHRARDRFPDGLYYVDLAEPGPDLALGRDPPPARMPEPLGRHALVLLDGVSDADHVRTLVSRVPGRLFLVTSRAPLEGLAPVGPSPTRIGLDVLSPAEATGLLRHLVGALRAGTEAQAVADLARACAYLPLAMRAAAAGVVGNPCRPIADFARELAVTARR